MYLRGRHACLNPIWEVAVWTEEMHVFALLHGIVFVLERQVKTMR